MAKFLTGEHLNSELVKIFENSEEQIVIISPYIKLHPRIKDSLKYKLNEPKINITVVFGKNENNVSKSLGQDTFEFFKEFPNIEIKYEPRLHAKYYSNESDSILSSMNLYDFSQNNNIEFGILTKVHIFSSISEKIIGESLDSEACTYFSKVAESSETLFQRVPVFDKKMLGITKKYSHSETKIDSLSQHFGLNTSAKKITQNDPPSDRLEIGYCIRTGAEIPFNPGRPLSDKAYASWVNYGDENYAEKYCHFSGEASYGETSFAKPILRKNWKKSHA